jgi:hypothetical protein
MDDNFLYDLRREPAPEFARRLRASLHDRSSETQGHPFGRRATKWAAMAASFALVSLAFTLPSFRAGAQAFLDLFRVVDLVGISVNAERLTELHVSELHLTQMLGGRVEVLITPGDPASVETPEAASAAAGSHVLEPAWVPVGWERAGIEVRGEHAFRVRTSTAGMNELLELLGIDDLSIPVELDGRIVTVRVPPVVTTTYRNGDKRVRFLQARSPEVSFPADLDLSVLAETGLRVLGLERDEAYRLARTIDWRTTLLVPVPAAAASFRQVDVAGRSGLMIEPRQRPGISVLLWASDDRVYAISGPLRPAEVLEMALTAQ